MPQELDLVTVVVRDYDEAIAFYTRVLGWELLEDSPVGNDDLGNAKRWVRVRPAGADGKGSGASLLLARGVTHQQKMSIGSQTGGRVGFFVRTDDFTRDYEAMKARGVKFVREPAKQAYGVVAVFEDLYGNKFDLIGP